MEWLDVVDEEGVPTGERVPRDAAHQEGLRHRTAHVWVWREGPHGKQVLLQKRSADKESFPGCWDTSSAGHIPAGDEPAASALRELAEELGVSMLSETDLTEIGRFRIRYQKPFHGKLFSDNEVTTVYMIRLQWDEARFIPQPEELECVAWHDVQAVHQALEAHDPAYCVPKAGFALVEEALRK